MRVGRIWGINIQLDFTCLFGLVFFFLSFYPFFASNYPSHTAIVMAIVSAIAIYVFCLAHELAHAWMALRNGVNVSVIILHLLGGAAVMADEAPTPWALFKIAIIGPISSLAIAGLFLLSCDIATSLGINQAVSNVLSFYGLINLVLAIFNLLPINGLDGGRAFVHVPLWLIQKDMYKSLMWAARGSQIVLLPLIIYAFILAQFWLGTIFIALLVLNEVEFRAARAKRTDS